MVLKIFKIAEIEGEDFNLNDMIYEDNYEIFNEIKELLKYPPRIVISKLYIDDKWRGVVLKAVRTYLSSDRPITR
ncbi:MAG: hypothetical protein DRO23_02965 [Thermoprotei archaeon]|nr:MAG: hypothetical protein DRO23_02965 [Thermoprotei archaeon]